MRKLNEFKIPDFRVTKKMVHPSYPELIVEMIATPACVDEIEIEDEEVERVVVSRLEDCNLAAWFDAYVMISSDRVDVTPVYIILNHCTHDSFDDFMEDEIFLQEVNELTQDLFKANKHNPEFLFALTPTSRMLS